MPVNSLGVQESDNARIKRIKGINLTRVRTRSGHQRTKLQVDSDWCRHRLCYQYGVSCQGS
jgi:hypothetical protein